MARTIDETTDPLDEFPEEVHDAVHGLAWLGHLEQEVEIAGHTFLLRTAKADEELQAALLAKEYADTYGQIKAWAWANIAVALEAVDGEPDFCPPIGPDKKSWVRAKFNYITSNWYWPVGNRLFEEYTDLLRRQAEAMEALENLSTGSLTPSTPSSDSLTGPVPSLDDLIDSNSS